MDAIIQLIWGDAVSSKREIVGQVVAGVLVVAITATPVVLWQASKHSWGWLTKLAKWIAKLFKKVEVMPFFISRGNVVEEYSVATGKKNDLYVYSPDEEEGLLVSRDSFGVNSVENFQRGIFLKVNGLYRTEGDFIVRITKQLPSGVFVGLAVTEKHGVKKGLKAIYTQSGNGLLKFPNPQWKIAKEILP